MSVKQTKLLNLNASNTAILVVDKQYGYFDRPDKKIVGTLSLQKALPIIDEFIQFAREKNYEVVWTQMLENKTESAENVKTMLRSDPIPNNRTFLNDISYEIIGLKPNTGEKIIHKLYYDAFAKTELESYLNSKNIKNVILVGGYTSRCILGTCYGANGVGLNVVVCPELVATIDKYVDEQSIALRIIDTMLGWSLKKQEIQKFMK